MQIARLAGLEGLVFRPEGLRLPITQIARPMPSQAAIKARARNLRVQELPDHRQQVVDQHQQRLSKNHRHRLLRRCQRDLQPVRRMASVKHTVQVPSFADGLLVCRENDSPDRFLVFPN